MADGWAEPTRRIPLRWGTWTGRSWGGLALILSGAVAVAGASAANSYTLLLAATGLTAHLVGWAILPAKGWRRVVVLVPSLFAVAALIAGPSYLTLLVLPLLGWFLVRQRPLRVWPMAAFVLGAGIILRQLYPAYEGMLTASAVALFVLAGSAWAARAVHAASTRPRRTLRRKTPPPS